METCNYTIDKFWDSYQQSLIADGLTKEEIDYYRKVYGKIYTKELRYETDLDGGAYLKIAKKIIASQQGKPLSHIHFHFGVDSQVLGANYIDDVTIYTPISARFYNKRLSLSELNDYHSGANLHVHKIIESYTKDEYYDVLRLGLFMVLNSKCFDNTTIESSHQDIATKYLMQFAVLVGIDMEEYINDFLSLSRHASTCFEKLRQLKSNKPALRLFLEPYHNLTHITVKDYIDTSDINLGKHLNGPGLILSPDDLDPNLNKTWGVNRLVPNHSGYLENDFTNPDSEDYLPRRVNNFIKNL
jgi:hypothetical protein